MRLLMMRTLFGMTRASRQRRRGRMRRLWDSFWRALWGCVHPRVILVSLLPLLLAGGAVAAAGWLWWTSAVAGVGAMLQDWGWLAGLFRWLEDVGGSAVRDLIAPLIVVALAVPVVVILTLLVVAWTMTPALVDLVARRRFPLLERRGAASAWLQGVVWSTACTVLALATLVLSLPLWLVPPLALVIPALVWGWLAAQVFAFDTLAAHATPEERRTLTHRHRFWLLAMGIGCGLLGSVPWLVWVAGALTIVFAPLLALVSVWLYTLVFAFASLWYAHYTLAALERLRADPSALESH